MKHYLLYTLIGCMFWLVGCSYENQINPDDTLAFYLIEGYHENIDLDEITIHSIKEFGNRIVGYGDIVSYDTSNYIFEFTGTSKENIDSLVFARYARQYPVAVISEGEFLFGVYINHPACSSIPYWFYLEPYTLPPWPNCYLYFCLPVYADETIEPDLRIDARMLQVLGRVNKLK